MLNLAIVIGVLTKEPQFRSLSGDTSVASFDLHVNQLGREQDVVPVSLTLGDDPDIEAVLTPGQDLLVIGRVRRRFFRARGATQSRTELVAERVQPLDDEAHMGDLITGIVKDVLADWPSAEGGKRAAEACSV